MFIPYLSGRAKNRQSNERNMDSTKAVTHLGLCAGYGGIELGLKRVIRNLRTVALCEVEAFAIANLVAKMEAGLMDPAPIWPDLKTFPYESFHRRVDILTGGYPCQPFSAAGQRKGKQDPRHLWPFIADGIRLLRPKLCFFENVEGHISLGLSDVIEDLAGMGYRTTWGIFSASECGAPHQRKRVFILAYRDDCGSREDIKSSQLWSDWLEQSSIDSGGTESGEVAENSSGSDKTMANSRHLLSGRWSESARSKYSDASNGGQTVGHSIQSGMEGSYDNRKSSERLQPDAVQSDPAIWPSYPGERQQPWEPPRVCETQPPMGRDTDGAAGRMDYAELCVTCDNRTDELRLLGNGVVPATAALAFRTLARELLG